MSALKRFQARALGENDAFVFLGPATRRRHTAMQFLLTHRVEGGEVIDTETRLVVTRVSFTEAGPVFTHVEPYDEQADQDAIVLLADPDAPVERKRRGPKVTW